MLAIRMQRTGRKGHAMFRVVVQNSRVTPTSGNVVAFLGSYDPHAKSVILDKEKAATFLSNGAQPSERVARLLKAEGVELPSWVVFSTERKRSLRHPEKLRRNQPKEEAVVAEVAVDATPPEETPVEPPTTTEVETETESETVAETPTEEPTAESAAESTDAEA
jgi:small subunit ribosomal protein S16